jgi:zinc/manganese transport system permease protein
MNPVAGATAMLSEPFMQHAFIAATAIACLCGVVGYFVVLRAQVFAGDALSHVAYAGALGALAAGADARLGLFTATVTVGLLLGMLGGRRGADDVLIGTTFAWILGLGVLFLALFTTHRANGNSAANVTVLFGSVFGISASAAIAAAGLAAALVALLLAVARPLLFASIDSAVAAARGVPVRLLGAAFLAVVGATAAEAAQVVGALLLLGLLAAPPAAALRLTTGPWSGLALSVVFCVLSVWAGLSLSYAVPTLPPSFTVIAVASALFAGASVRGTARRPRPCG